MYIVLINGHFVDVLFVNGFSSTEESMRISMMQFVDYATLAYLLSRHLDTIKMVCSRVHSRVKVSVQVKFWNDLWNELFSPEMN